MSGSTPGRPARITAAHTAALAAALATVHADTKRPLTKAGCYQRVGDLLGISGGAAQDRLLAAGLAVTPRPRGTVSCSRCGTPTREVLAWATARAGECGRCQRVRAVPAGAVSGCADMRLTCCECRVEKR